MQKSTDSRELDFPTLADLFSDLCWKAEQWNVDGKETVLSELICVKTVKRKQNFYTCQPTYVRNATASARDT